MLLAATTQALANDIVNSLGFVLTLLGFLIVTALLGGLAYLIGYVGYALNRRLRRPGAQTVARRTRVAGGAE
jgi:hypothetical protein